MRYKRAAGEASGRSVTARARTLPRRIGRQTRVRRQGTTEIGFGTGRERTETSRCLQSCMQRYFLLCWLSHLSFWVAAPSEGDFGRGSATRNSGLRGALQHFGSFFCPGPLRAKEKRAQATAASARVGDRQGQTVAAGKQHAWEESACRILINFFVPSSSPDFFKLREGDTAKTHRPTHTDCVGRG